MAIEELPDGVSAEFNPAQLSLSPQKPEQTTQLNIRASGSAVLGKHKFTVTASLKKGDSKEIQLTLEVKAPTVTKTESLPNYPNPFNSFRRRSPL